MADFLNCPRRRINFAQPYTFEPTYDCDTRDVLPRRTYIHTVPNAAQEKADEERKRVLDAAPPELKTAESQVHGVQVMQALYRRFLAPNGAKDQDLMSKLKQIPVNITVESLPAFLENSVEFASYQPEPFDATASPLKPAQQTHNNSPARPSADKTKKILAALSAKFGNDNHFWINELPKLNENPCGYCGVRPLSSTAAACGTP